MKDIGAYVRYAVLWGMVSKMVRAGVQLCCYPAAPSFYVMAGLSGARVVRVPCMVMAILCCAAAFVGVGVAVEFARLRLTAHCSASTKRFMFLLMPRM